MPDPLDNQNVDTDNQGADNAQQSQGDTPHTPANDVEALARIQGWRPREEYTGDPAKYVDASVFVDRANSFKSNLINKVSALERQIKTYEGTAAQFAKYHKEAIEKKDKELATAIRQLKVQRSEATADGDHSQAVELEDRIEELNRQREETRRLEEEALKQAQAQEAEQQVDPALTAWIADGNQWFDTDPKLRRYAMGVAEQLRADGNKLSGREFLDRMLLEVKADFPEKFTNPNRSRAAAVDSGPSGSSRSGRTAADLPAEDRALMQRFVKEGYLTEKQFLADYKWSN